MFCFVLFFRQDLTLSLCTQASLELTMCPGWPRLTSILLPQSHKITGLSNQAWPRKVISKSTAPHQLSKPSSSYRAGPCGQRELFAGMFSSYREVTGIGSTLTKRPGDRPQHSAVDALPLGLGSHLAIRQKQCLGEHGNLSQTPGHQESAGKLGSCSTI